MRGLMLALWSFILRDNTPDRMHYNRRDPVAELLAALTG
jgi:hypothetical protein